MHKGTVYLSGPITGLTYKDARYGWREYVYDNLASDITVLSPMRHEGHLAEQRAIPAIGTGHFFTGSRIIFEKDKLDIQRSDIVLANLLEQPDRVSIGTVGEINMAYAMGKQIILVIQDNGNIHDHPFVFVPASLRLNNIGDAIYAINSLLSEGI